MAPSAALAALQTRRTILANSSFASSGAALPRRHRRCCAAAAATPLGLLAELPAQASEAFIDISADVGQPAAEAAADAAAAQAAAAAADALAAAQQAAESDPTQLVFTALFGVAIAALSLVTLGVAYLSFTTWMDGRTEEEDRRRAQAVRSVSSGSSNGAGATKAPKKEAAAKEAGEFKGFGSKK